MKALTLHQPWASLIAWRLKRFETRHWPTSYRGELAIHAAVRDIDRDMLEAIYRDPLTPSELRVQIYDSKLPRGAFVALATLDECHRTTGEFIEGLSAREQEYGFFRPGRFAWDFRESAIRIPEPIRCRGQQGLWDVPGEVLGVLRESARKHAAGPYL